MDVDEPVPVEQPRAQPMSQERLRQLFPLPTGDAIVDAPQGAVYNTLGETWYAPEGYADSISIPEDDLRQVHETVGEELNLTSCPYTVSSVSPYVMYAYTKRVY